MSLFLKLGYHGFLKFVPDKIYLSVFYRKKMGRKIDFKNPILFNEKLQYLKIYDRNPLYTILSDKYEVKKYLAPIIGNQYLIPTIGVWDRFEDIDFEQLPSKFVLKCNHDSGSVIICKDKSKFDFEAAKRKINTALKKNYYYPCREWSYKNIKPKIIAEKYMVDSSEASEITDYKFYCFNGKVDCVMVCLERKSGNTKFYFFDKQWNLKRINERGMKAPDGFTIEKPFCMDEMFELAEKITKNIPFVRLDLYQCDNHIYFGEYTFYPASGFDKNYLYETELYFGQLINLDNVYSKKGD